MKHRNSSLMEKAVRAEESRIIKSGENWMHLGGLMPRCCKTAYFIAAVYLLLVNMAYFLSLYLNSLDAQLYPENYNMTAVRSAMLVMCVTAVAMIAAFVLVILKKYLPALILSLPAAVVTAVFFYGENYKVRLEDGVKGFVFKHLLPVLIYILAILIIFIISMRDRRRVYGIYDREEAALYAKYRASHPNVSSDEWKDYLAAYDACAPAGDKKDSSDADR